MVLRLRVRLLCELVKRSLIRAAIAELCPQVARCFVATPLPRSRPRFARRARSARRFVVEPMDDARKSEQAELIA